MNLGFYGHTNMMVYTSTKDGKFSKTGFINGMKQIYGSAQRALETGDMDISFMQGNPNSDEYRRDYYRLEQFKTVDGQKYSGISDYLGYEEGTIPYNIFSVLPEDTPSDVLFVWDEGYGSLKLPDCKHVLWASNKALPDKEQFGRIANDCFLLLDGNVLRSAGAMISTQNSWERTATDLIAELQNNPAISYLLNARQILITFDVDGAVYILPKRKDGQLEASLIVTHGEVEGTVYSKPLNQSGSIIIFLLMASCLTTSAASILADPNIDAMGNLESLDLFGITLNTMIQLFAKLQLRSETLFESVESDVVRWGSALRGILEVGETAMYSNVLQGFHNEDTLDTTTTRVKLKDWPAFSIPLIQNGNTLIVPSDWTVTNSIGRQIPDVALDYVQNGSAAIDGLPQLSLGALTTVDRAEIESYQNIRNLILDYANGESTRPLSIAVFGSPGSGKSFGVTQIAQNILPGKVEKLEFNVSQFTSLSDLGIAFQKVRDTILHGKLPLVFFDEFDSDKDGQSLGWLKTFLMPMQDGKFRDDSGEHPLGRCILVFAGGTAATFEEFAKPIGLVSADSPVSLEHPPGYLPFKNIKGPDFISRLRGTINVLGPNPNDKLHPEETSDKNYILRRALLLRSLCQRNSIKSISENIIHAMLHVPEYKHGARSMEAILDMSRISGNSWEPVSLPSHSQLSLHVDADAFIKLVLANRKDTTE